MLTTRRLRANLLLLACAAIWGFAFVAQSVGAHVGAFTFNATRFALGAVSLLPIIAWLDRRTDLDAAARRTRWREVVLPGLVCGAFLFGGSSLQQLGIETTTAGNAAFVTGLYVVLVPLVGIAFGHRTPANAWAGAAIAVVGLYLLTVTSGWLSMKHGDLLCLVGTAFWTAHILAIGRFSRRVDVLRLSVAQFLATSGYAAASALAFEHPSVEALSGVLIPIGYAGIVSVGIAFTLQVVAQADAVASSAAIIMSLEAVFGALGGALFLGEAMTSRGYLGAALMMAGIIWSQLPSRNRAAVSLPVPEPPSTAFQED